MAKAKKPSGPTPVEAVQHLDTRANIPTEELRDFVADDEAAPGTMLYPRDPALDPQLVWKGKDEQDRDDLEVPVVPVYIQEKIDPRALVENLRDTALKGEAEPEMTLFGDFDGLEFEELVEFYEHDANWSNRLILGDSLLVMTSLAEKEGLKGTVQTIYVDPPYGIKFGSNWQVSTRKRDVKDGKVEDLTRQPEQIRAFRDTWQFGIHSYLSYLRDRFVVARDLLTETGSIFVQIGDENIHRVRALLDEVFGDENFVALITVQTTTGASSPAAKTNTLASLTDFVVWYAKSADHVKYRQVWLEAAKAETSGYRWLMLPDGTYRGLTAAEMRGQATIPEEARIYKPDNIQSPGGAGDQPFEHLGRTYAPGKNAHWKASLDGMGRLALAGRIHVAKNSIQYVRFADDFRYQPLGNVWTDVGTGNFTDPKTYVVQTNSRIVERCLLMTTDPGDLVLDPTCGSGTAAVAAEHWGRRWITIDTSRVAITLARTRLMAARYPYYLLADSPEGAEKEAGETGVTPHANDFANDVRKGFVLRRAQRITLGSIARNTEIVEGMTRADIDAAITRNAEQELLVDQPYQDKKRVRVSGRFTVESLSPHRVLEDHARPASERAAEREPGVVQFVDMVLDNLRKAGVQNTIKDERLVFDRLEAYAGEWLHAEGEFTDKSGETRRVAVSIGPEHGTVGPLQIKEASKEAVKGVGFDILVVCGFAFDARVGEVAKEFGKLAVLPARMNPDLAMGDEVLKKTGAGNLFTVFGEPDVTIKEEAGQITVEIRGVDVYDPTTGAVRSNTTDDIACWFIDTDYNGESFFVRHAYFTGADDPYQRLKRALKAEIDEAAWASLYATTSRPFPPPSTGKIAIKVINHYGDEVMQVYETGGAA